MNAQYLCPVFGTCVGTIVLEVGILADIIYLIFGGSFLILFGAFHTISIYKEVKLAAFRAEVAAIEADRRRAREAAEREERMRLAVEEAERQRVKREAEEGKAKLKAQRKADKERERREAGVEPLHRLRKFLIR